MILTFIYLRFSLIYTSCAVNCVSVIMLYIFFLHSFIKYTCSEGIILHTNTTDLRHFFTNWLSILTFPSFSTPASWSCIFMSQKFHPCKLVPQIHVSHFQPLHFWPSRICSRPRQSTEGSQLATEICLNPTRTAPPCYNMNWKQPPLGCVRVPVWQKLNLLDL